MFKKSSRVLFVTLLLFVLAGATYAFAATNTVLETFAGDGEGEISGYVVSSVTYTTNGSYITGVSFSLDGAAKTVQAAIGTTYDPVDNDLVSCSLSGTTWSCTFPSDYVTIVEAEGLRVVAFQ